MFSFLISRLVTLVFGTLYPSYASYKAMKEKDVQECVKWMMYWIVFALLTSMETFTDVLLFWIPFYYELKIVLLLWLISPATMGAGVLYRKIVHPLFSEREKDIDEYISTAERQSYRKVLALGARSVSVLMQTAFENFKVSTSASDSFVTSRRCSARRFKNTRDQEVQYCPQHNCVEKCTFGK